MQYHDTSTPPLLLTYRLLERVSETEFGLNLKLPSNEECEEISGNFDIFTCSDNSSVKIALFSFFSASPSGA